MPTRLFKAILPFWPARLLWTFFLPWLARQIKAVWLFWSTRSTLVWRLLSLAGLSDVGLASVGLADVGLARIGLTPVVRCGRLSRVAGTFRLGRLRFLLVHHRWFGEIWCRQTGRVGPLLRSGPSLGDLGKSSRLPLYLFGPFGKLGESASHRRRGEPDLFRSIRFAVGETFSCLSFESLALPGEVLHVPAQLDHPITALLIDRHQPSGKLRASLRFVDRQGNLELLGSVSPLAPEQVLHGPIGVRRTSIGMSHPVIEPATNMPAPIALGLVMAEVPTVVDVERFVGHRALIQCEPWLDADCPVSRIVVIAEVVVIVGRPAEEVILDNVNINQHDRNVAERRLCVDRRLQTNRSKAQSAPGHRVVPVPRDKHTATGRPQIAIGNPNPIQPDLRPIAGSPHITGVLPDPRAGNPELIVGRLWTVRTAFEGARRHGQIAHLLLLLLVSAAPPVTGDPSVTVVNLIPVSRNPFSAGWRHTPYSANPNEIVLVFTPRPVTGNPNGFLVFGPLLWRQLLDQRGRLAWSGDPRLRIVRNHFGKPFVNRAACQGFDAWLVDRLGLLQRLSRRSILLSRHFFGRSEHHGGQEQNRNRRVSIG